MQAAIRSLSRCALAMMLGIVWTGYVRAEEQVVPLRELPTAVMVSAESVSKVEDGEEELLTAARRINPRHTRHLGNRPRRDNY